jgi:hypothetical protein
MVNNVLVVNAPLTILFLSDTYGGRVHDLRLAEATPYPLPAGSQLLQDLGFLAFTLPLAAILRPAKKPRGQELTLAQQLANQALHDRRLRIEHVNRSVKRYRSVKDRLRLWKAGVRDLVRVVCPRSRRYNAFSTGLAGAGAVPCPRSATRERRQDHAIRRQ